MDPRYTGSEILAWIDQTFLDTSSFMLTISTGDGQVFAIAPHRLNLAGRGDKGSRDSKEQTLRQLSFA